MIEIKKGDLIHVDVLDKSLLPARYGVVSNIRIGGLDSEWFRFEEGKGIQIASYWWSDDKEEAIRTALSTIAQFAQSARILGTTWTPSGVAVLESPVTGWPVTITNKGPVGPKAITPAVLPECTCKSLLFGCSCEYSKHMRASRKAQGVEW